MTNQMNFWNETVDVGDGSIWEIERKESPQQYREELWEWIESNEDEAIRHLLTLDGKRPTWRKGSKVSHLPVLRAAVNWARNQ